MGAAFSPWDLDEHGALGEGARAKALIRRVEARWEAQDGAFHAVIGSFTVRVERRPEPGATWEWSAFSPSVRSGPRALRCTGWPHAEAAQRDAETSLGKLI